MADHAVSYHVSSVQDRCIRQVLSLGHRVEAGLAPVQVHPVEPAAVAGEAQAIATFGDADDGAALTHRFVALSAEPALRAVDDVRDAGIDSGRDVFARSAGNEVVTAVTVEVDSLHRAAKQVMVLGAAGDAALLAEREIVGDPEASLRAVEHVDLTGVVVGLEVFIRNADGQVVAAVAVEVPGGQRSTEAIARVDGAVDSTRLRELGVVLDAQPARRAIQHVHLARVDLAFDILPGHPDRQVVSAVAIEVACGQCLPEQVAALGVSLDGSGLAELLAAACAKAVGRAVEDDHRAGVGLAVDVLTGHPNGEIVVAVAVEVADSQGAAEPVVTLGVTDDTAGLAEELIPRCAKPTGRPVEDVDRAGVDDATVVLTRYANGDIAEAVTIEVAESHCAPEPIAGLE